MSPPPIKVSRTAAERKHDAFVAAGAAPSRFGRREPARGERQHPRHRR